jgi:hypothetical protein
MHKYPSATGRWMSNSRVKKWKPRQEVQKRAARAREAPRVAANLADEYRKGAGAAGLLIGCPPSAMPIQLFLSNFGRLSLKTRRISSDEEERSSLSFESSSIAEDLRLMRMDMNGALRCWWTSSRGVSGALEERLSEEDGEVDPVEISLQPQLRGLLEISSGSESWLWVG